MKYCYICITLIYRLGIKSGVNIRELRIGVKEADMSYMPEHVVILAGDTVDNLRKINEVHIPRSVTVFVLSVFVLVVTQNCILTGDVVSGLITCDWWGRCCTPACVIYPFWILLCIVRHMHCTSSSSNVWCWLLRVKQLVV